MKKVLIIVGLIVFAIINLFIINANQQLAF